MSVFDRLSCIAAASVLAKVTRDRVMTELDADFPGYGFAVHKGYSTSVHMEALGELGPSTQHRMRYQNVRAALAADGMVLDGTGASEVATGVGFYDHMLASLAKHALFDLRVKTTGDLHVDAHHTVEDTAIVLGQALREALGDKRGISRFGDATVPLDEALVQAVVDVAGRPYCVHTGEPAGQEYALLGGTYAGSLTRHVFETLAHHAGIALHVRVLSGRDPHHVVEAQFKALARARMAGETDGFVKIVAEKKYDEVLGVHIIGPRATELVAEAVMMLRMECTVEELVKTIHAHPTMSEAVGEAAHASHGAAIHI